MLAIVSHASDAAIRQRLALTGPRRSPSTELDLSSSPPHVGGGLLSPFHLFVKLAFLNHCLIEWWTFSDDLQVETRSILDFVTISPIKSHAVYVLSTWPWSFLTWIIEALSHLNLIHQPFQYEGTYIFILIGAFTCWILVYKWHSKPYNPEIMCENPATCDFLVEGVEQGSIIVVHLFKAARYAAINIESPPPIIDPHVACFSPKQNIMKDPKIRYWS